MKKEMISERVFWNLVDDFENVDSLTPKVRKSFKYYVNQMQSRIEDLEAEVEYVKEQFDNYKRQQENDYDPEIEVPPIHGKGISW